jgi:hypothetical protein
MERKFSYYEWSLSCLCFLILFHLLGKPKEKEEQFKSRQEELIHQQGDSPGDKDYNQAHRPFPVSLLHSSGRENNKWIAIRFITCNAINKNLWDRFSCPTWACPRNLTWDDGRYRKNNRQKTKPAQSWGQVGWALGWRHHNSPLHLQWAYYIQRQTEVKQQFSGEGVWHCNSQEQEEPVTTSLWM